MVQLLCTLRITQDSTQKKKEKKKKVNEYFKGNDLKNIFKNFL